MTAWEYVRELHGVCSFMSKEREGEASSSELKRWLQSQVIQLNGRRIKWDEKVDFSVKELILFPRKNKTTIL